MDLTEKRGIKQGHAVQGIHQTTRQKDAACEEWLELARDLQDPIETGSLPAELRMRWADKGDLMAAVRGQGGSHMIASMCSNWHASIRMHTKLGFRIQRRLSQCNLLNIFPTPPKAV